MTRLQSAMSAAGLLLACAQLARGQSATALSNPQSELSVAIGVSRSARRDLSASPLNFAGRGGDASLKYERRLGAFSAQVALDGSARTLVSSSSAAQAQERLDEGAVAFVLLRELGGQGAKEN